MLDYDQLAALAAVVRSGSFERAARQLNLTPSAVSQRIRLLEERVGALLVVRGQPCRATPAGERLCQHCEQVALLESSLGGDLIAAPAGRVTVRIAVSADCLATWFVEAMARTGGVLFDLVLDDQDHSADWLRRGEVLAAITSRGEPLQGCDCHALAPLRYVATASPAFAARWFPDGVTAEAAARAPCLTFNRKDRLQEAWLRQVLGTTVEPPCHWLPSSQAFVDGALAGLGWGMSPRVLAAPHLEAGRLTALGSGEALAVPLYWQMSRIAAGVLGPLTAAVLACGRDGPAQPRAGNKVPDLVLHKHCDGL